jgi:hypothetical protein
LREYCYYCIAVSTTVILTTVLVDVTERSGSVGNVPNLYSGGDRFESRPGHQISFLRFFLVLFSPRRQVPI